MALQSMLAKLGPTLVREATPHLMQAVVGISERFRKDTREIKTAVQDEMASLARTHAGLITANQDQRDRLEALQSQITVVDRRLELLHITVERLTRQLASDAEATSAAQRRSALLAGVAAACAALACGAAVTLLVLHR